MHLDLIPVFADRLDAALKLAGLSPADLRRRLEDLGIDVSRNHVYKLLDGTRPNPTFELIAGISAVTGVQVGWFFDMELPGDQPLSELVLRYVRASSDQRKQADPGDHQGE